MTGLKPLMLLSTNSKQYTKPPTYSAGKVQHSMSHTHECNFQHTFIIELNFSKQRL